MGNGEWGMGNGEWGMGNGEWETGNGKCAECGRQEINSFVRTFWCQVSGVRYKKH